MRQGGAELLVDFAVPAGLSGGEEATAAVGVPAAVAQPLAAVVVEPVDSVDRRALRGAAFPVQEALPQGGGEGLVGIDAEDPLARGQRVGVVLLPGVALPGVGHKMRPGLAADGLGAVGRTTVDDHHLVGHATEALQAAADVALLVVGDDDGC